MILLFVVGVPFAVILFYILRIIAFHFFTHLDITANVDGRDIIQIEYSQFKTLFDLNPDKYTWFDYHTIRYQGMDEYIYIFFKTYADYRQAVRIVKVNDRIQEKRKIAEQMKKAMEKYTSEIRNHDIPKTDEEQPKPATDEITTYECMKCKKQMKSPYLVMDFQGEDGRTKAYLCEDCSHEYVEHFLKNMVEEWKGV